MRKQIRKLDWEVKFFAKVTWLLRSRAEIQTQTYLIIISRLASQALIIKPVRVYMHDELNIQGRFAFTHPMLNVEYTILPVLALFM